MIETRRKYEVLLSQSGHRRTVQRQGILQVLEETDDHLTIEQLLARLQAILPPVSLSTIYRNVEVLGEMGLIRTNHLPSGGATYELVDGKPHVHLVCQHCHSVTHLDVRQLETLQGVSQATAHFHIVSLTLTISGYCATCWDLLAGESLRKMEGL